jgi:hypothetical protein
VNLDSFIRVDWKFSCQTARNLAGILAFCKTTENVEATIDNVGKDPVERLNAPRDRNVEAVAPILSESDGG